jgi:hypothetical protein
VHRALLVILVSCGGAVPAPAPRPAAPLKPVTVTESGPPVDPIAVLTPVDDADVSWLVPGRVQLELGGAAIEGPGGDRPIEVTVIDRQANVVRAAIRLPHARFSLWTSADRLLAILRHDQKVRVGLGAVVTQMEVVLRGGAKVRRLARRNGESEVRYVGAVEVDGWVPDDALVDAAPPHDTGNRLPTGRRTLMVSPGAIIRTEARWGADTLAVMANGYFLDTLQEIDDAWVEVAYTDGDVALHGYVSRHDPPGSVHHVRDPDLAPATVVPNTKVASGTCLYAKPGGDPLGYIVGDHDVELDDRGNGWWALATDTPWGPIDFAARGPTAQSLVACAPPGSVPAPAAQTAPTTPQP